MNYFIERGRNIENADEMNEALQCANAFCGFNSCVIEILEKKKYKKQKHISNISKIHAIMEFMETMSATKHGSTMVLVQERL